MTNSVNNNNHYTPKGDFSATEKISHHLGTGQKEQLLLLLLDRRIYTGDLAKLRTIGPVALPDQIPLIWMYGIINFGSDTSGNILLPQNCFALKLNWNGIQKGNFTPSEDVMIRSGKPLSFTLKSKKGFKIPKEELKEHGMQLVFLYL